MFPQTVYPPDLTWCFRVKTVCDLRQKKTFKLIQFKEFLERKNTAHGKEQRDIKTFELNEMKEKEQMPDKKYKRNRNI